MGKYTGVITAEANTLKGRIDCASIMHRNVSHKFNWRNPYNFTPIYKIADKWTIPLCTS